MITGNLAEWIREEHLKVSQHAQQLREKVVSLPSGPLDAWGRGLRQQFEKFRAHLIKHFALEEDGGYLDAVLEHRPNMSRQVDQLQQDHVQLTRLMDSITAQLALAGPDDRLLTRDVCTRLQSLLCYICEHEQQEDLLVLSVFTDDIGTKD